MSTDYLFGPGLSCIGLGIALAFRVGDESDTSSQDKRKIGRDEIYMGRAGNEKDIQMMSRSPLHVTRMLFFMLKR